MASTPPKNDVFMREVDEELRRDQMMAFGRKYGALVIGLIVVALLAFAGVLYWRYHREQVAGTKGEQLQKVVESLGEDKPDIATPLNDLSHSDIGGYRAMALFSQADLLVKKNDLKGAAAKFAAIAGDTKLSQPFRDLALIRQTSVQFDDLKPDEVVSRLRSLAVKGGPWFGSAGELVAIAYLQMNKPDLAAKMFSDIGSDETVPESIRQRAVQMASSLNAQIAGQDEDKAAK